MLWVRARDCGGTWMRCWRSTGSNRCFVARSSPSCRRVSTASSSCSDRVRAAQVSLAPRHSFADDEDTAELRERATAVATELDQLATAMQARGDARHWFTRVYQFVTEAIRDAADRGEITNVSWALRLILGFHDYFMRSVEGPAEAHWQEAFAAIEAVQSASGRSAVALWKAIVAGARAHIEGDLPRVLAHVLPGALRRSLRLRPVPRRLPASRFADTAGRETDVGGGVRRVLPALCPCSRPHPAAEATEYLLAKRVFDPLELRRTAFDRGRELAEGAAAGCQVRVS